MKKLLIAISFLICARSAVAQTSSKSKKSKHIAAKKSKPSSQTTIVDNRKNIMYPDGQKATPTGHEASAINSEKFEAIRDTAKNKKKQ